VLPTSDVTIASPFVASYIASDHELQLDLGVHGVVVAERMLLLPAVDPLPQASRREDSVSSARGYSRVSLGSNLLRVADDSGCARARFFEISAGSMSMGWMNFARGANSASLP